MVLPDLLDTIENALRLNAIAREKDESWVGASMNGSLSGLVATLVIGRHISLRRDLRLNIGFLSFE